MRDALALGPAVAGSWYPGNREKLAGLVDGLLDAAAERNAGSSGPVAALIAPHAGFAYSGAVAASAFSRLRGSSFDRIVLLGPSHYFGFHGAAVPDAAAVYRTPLGEVSIDLEAVSTLREAAGFRADDALFTPEHALEAELPFLQRVVPGDVAIVPVLLGGRATHEETHNVAVAIAPFVTASTLVVVSSDFTHFGPRFGYAPFSENVPARIRDLDAGAVSVIEAGDAAAFARYVEATGATICGHRAIDVLLRLPLAAAGGTLIEYDTSGRMTGTWDHSVSYASIAVPARGARPQ